MSDTVLRIEGREKSFGENAKTRADLKDARRRNGVRGDLSSVDDRVERVLVDEKILAQHLVRVESVFKAPGLHLAWACEVHLENGDGTSCRWGED